MCAARPAKGGAAPSRPVCCSIVPPHVLARLIEEGTPEQRNAAVQTMAATASMRAQRALIGRFARDLGPSVRSAAFLQPPAAPQEGARQSVYDAENGGANDLPGALKRSSGDPAASDPAVNSVYDATEDTYAFYSEVMGRDSVDDHGMRLVSSVHYSRDLDNAMWNGRQMVYGDGSGHLFAVGALVKSIDVIGHELTHGVTEHTAGLEYSSQSGALNESFSDVFGSLVKQYTRKQSAADADWLIGEGTLAPGLGKALRSMAEPGSQDVVSRQPATMGEYEDLPDNGEPRNDNGGVHINSGIPNHAFYLAATAIGGNAWETAGQIWYRTLTGGSLNPDADFAEAAALTVQVAGEVDADAKGKVEEAWRQVGVTT